MKKLIIDKIKRIVVSREKLEDEFNVKIKNRGKEVYVDGKAEDEFLAEKAIEAIDFGFPFKQVLEMKKIGLDFEKINIKDYYKQKNLERIKSRIIGKNGKTLKTLSSLTDCYFEIKDSYVGIIGYPENMEKAMESIILLCQGTKHQNVYARLERIRQEPIIDLGLKNPKE